MKRLDPSCSAGSDFLPVTTCTPLYCGCTQEGGHAAITDVLTIGGEIVRRPVQMALDSMEWSFAHARSLEAAETHLESKRVAVVVAEQSAAESDWSTMVSRLRARVDPPEVILISSGDLLIEDALSAGAFDLLHRPLIRTDLMWAVAAAWHSWTTGRNNRYLGGLCSDA